MRIYYLIISILVTLTIAAGYMALHLQQYSSASADDIKNIYNIIDEFQSTHVPEAIVDFSDSDYNRFGMFSPIRSILKNSMLMPTGADCTVVNGINRCNPLQALQLNLRGAGLKSKYLSTLKDEEIKRISSWSDVILLEDHVLLRSNTKNYLNLEYFAYPKYKFNQFFNDRSMYVETVKPGQKCFYQNGGVCWRQDVAAAFATIGQASILIFGGLILAIAVLFWVLLKKIKNDKIENQKKRFGLEVLTHEFRTPVTNLVLQADKLNKLYGQMSKEMQEVAPVLTGEIYKLQRLTEETKRYLKVSKSNKMVDLNIESIASANEFVQSHIPLNDEDVKFEGLKEDSPLKADSYWLGICIKNLIANAKQHGVSPVKVHLAKNKSNSLSISVEDAGKCSSSDLQTLTREFYKTEDSDGYGLGLNVVKKVMDEMHGSLEFQPQPTKFTMVLRDH